MPTTGLPKKIGDASQSRPGYDLNGNILNLLRQGKTGDATFGQMDNLTYSYANGGNALTAVSDAVTTVAAENGFKEIVEGTLDYTYDANGNMTADANKGITAIEYNYQNLPIKVSKSATEYMVFTYNPAGQKLTQQTYGTKPRRIDYIGELVYEDNVLKTIAHDDGRIVITSGTPEYQYYLADQLGNTRVTFTSRPATTGARATLEDEQARAEQSDFLRYEFARRVRSPLFDHTRRDVGGHATRLSGTANEKYGLARSLNVMPGDTIKMEVFAKYVDTNRANWTAGMTSLMSSVTNRITNIVTDGVAYASSTASFPFAGLLKTPAGSDKEPKAFINWILFDHEYRYKDGGYVQMSTAAREYGQNTPHEQLSAAVPVTEPGYIYVYLSNESTTPVDVYFDDFAVTQVQSPIVQMDDYYPSASRLIHTTERTPCPTVGSSRARNTWTTWACIGNRSGGETMTPQPDASSTSTRWPTSITTTAPMPSARTGLPRTSNWKAWKADALTSTRSTMRATWYSAGFSMCWM